VIGCFPTIPERNFEDYKIKEQSLLLVIAYLKGIVQNKFSQGSKYY